MPRGLQVVVTAEALVIVDMMCIYNIHTSKEEGKWSSVCVTVAYLLGNGGTVRQA